ncbi:hypothetical protein IMZ48_35255 [Candidatus Bathyarchaeota archaeon]|nr:hypothetical protein [Candidatus Bathyarchaeota archaeon]
MHVLKPLPGAGTPMALSLFHLDGSLHLIAAYENGAAVVLRANLAAGEWVTLYKHQAHSQPVLSFDISPCRSYFITSSADAIIAKHPIPREPSGGDEKADAAQMLYPVSTPLKSVSTKHAGQQSLRIRSDGAIFATGGWDSKVRVYSAKSLKEVAVLKWHQSGCCSVAFAAVDPPPAIIQEKEAEGVSDPPGESGAVARTESGAPAYYDVKHKRVQHAKAAHWVAAGSKDGKVSLWDIY